MKQKTTKPNKKHPPKNEINKSQTNTEHYFLSTLHQTFAEFLVTRSTRSQSHLLAGKGGVVGLLYEQSGWSQQHLEMYFLHAFDVQFKHPLLTSMPLLVRTTKLKAALEHGPAL